MLNMLGQEGQKGKKGSPGTKGDKGDSVGPEGRVSHGINFNALCTKICYPPPNFARSVKLFCFYFFDLLLTKSVG